MSTLTALNVTGTINFGGPLDQNSDTGTTDTISTITNTGNQATIGLNVDGYGATDGDGLAMTCTTGSLIIGNEKYHITPATAYASKIALTDTATLVTSFSVAKTTTGTPSTTPLYWGIGTTGGSGICSGHVVFTAV
jgi:hypothetical protein